MARGKGPSKERNGAPAHSKKRAIDRYEHTGKKRVNNPPVGLVTPQTDPPLPTHKIYDYIAPVPTVKLGKALDHDPHLDPQLVWAGKKEHSSFEVNTVSLHVHETIDPRTIVEAVRRRNAQWVGGTTAVSFKYYFKSLPLYPASMPPYPRDACGDSAHFSWSPVSDLWSLSALSCRLSASGPNSFTTHCPLPTSHFNTSCLLNLASNSSIKTERKPMPDQPPSDRPPSNRFKADMPQIPGVTVPLPRPATPRALYIKLGLGILAVLVVAFLGVWWALRPGRVGSKAAEPQAQIEVPPPRPDPSTLIPHATGAAPVVATIEEMAKPWSSKQFFIRNIVSGVDVPGILIRLPTGSPARASGYWAFAVDAPYGNCKLEYITDLARLRTEYGFAAARHPMVVNPCTQTVFDPAKTTTLPGTGAIVQGALAQGSDLRPPLGIEIRVRGRQIEATR